MYSYINPLTCTGLFFLIAILGMSCEHVGPLESGPGEETLSSIQPLFTQNCAISGCHVGSNALLGLDLSEGQAYASLVGIASKEAPNLKLVEVNEPDLSYLIMKIEGSADIVAGTLLMPIGRSPLEDDDISRIREWIANGALDN